MTGMNNALLQLALMLRGNPALGGGFGSGGSSPYAPNFAPNPMTSQMPNGWANMPAPHHGTPGNHLSITPAQEIFLGPLNPAWEIPNWEIPNLPEWAIPKPEFFPIPDTGPLGPDIFPPLPLPYNPPRAIPDEGVDDDISEYGEKPRKMSGRCKEEWAAADLICQELREAHYRRGDFDTPFDMDRCKRGHVSQACGGTPVDWGSKGKPYKPQA